MAGKTKTKSANHLRAWRKHRKLTQGALAEKVGTTANVISQLESGVRRLSDTWLYKLAPALDTQPGYLLDHDPEDQNTRWTQRMNAVPEVERERVMAVIEAMFPNRAG